MSAKTLLELARAIAGGGAPAAALRAHARAVFVTGATRAAAKEHFLDAIGHYVYAGDTLLHVAAAAYDLAAAKALVAGGADVRARNRRGAEPIHYAADGAPGPELRGTPRATARRAPGPKTWDPRAQAAIVAFLLANGADPNALTKDGVGPLHRAVRTRSTGAVRALLAGGANPNLPNERGTTPMALATMTTGRGGSGSPEARRQQAAIVRLLGG